MANPREDLLNFLLKKKIPIRLAIDILERAQSEIEENKRGREKAVLPKYETR